MRRTTATTDYLKECMGTALLELMKEMHGIYGMKDIVISMPAIVGKDGV